jgi:hypothetical protein
MYCDAKKRDLEYGGRLEVGQDARKSILDMVPAIPYSINPSLNAEEEEKAAFERQKRKDAVTKNFNTRLQRRSERRHRRDETTHLMHLKRQVSLILKFND